MVAGRPQIWTPFARISWARDYQYTDDGRIRDKHRNVLGDYGPDSRVILRMYGSSRRKILPKRDILAMEYFGPPAAGDSHCCVICGQEYSEVIHLNDDRRDFSRSNLKRVPAYHHEAREHELRCCETIMQLRPHDPRRRPTLDNRLFFADDEHPIKSMFDVRGSPFKARPAVMSRVTSPVTEDKDKAKAIQD